MSLFPHILAFGAARIHNGQHLLLSPYIFGRETLIVNTKPVCSFIDELVIYLNGKKLFELKLEL